MNLLEIPGLFGLLIYVAYVLCDAAVKLVTLWMLLVALRLFRRRYILQDRTLKALDLWSFSTFLVNVVAAWAWGWLRLAALIVFVLIFVPTAITLRRRSKALATLLKEESHDSIDASHTNDSHLYH